MKERLDQATVDRVILRALQLDDHSNDDRLSSAAVVQAAIEAGISADAIRHALAMEQLGAGPPRRRLDTLAGARNVAAERAIDMPAATAFDRLDEWLAAGHHLRREQRTVLPDNGLMGAWRKRSDPVATVSRTLRSVGGGAGLGSVRVITATVARIDDGHSLVRIVADRTTGRRASLGVTGTMTATSVAGGAVVATVFPPLALVAAPGLAIAGTSALVSRRAAVALSRELARVLDQIANDRRPGMLTRRFA